MKRFLLLEVALLSLSTTLADGREDRDQKVRTDREAFDENERWIYNDLPRAFSIARKSGKPLLIVFR